MELVNPNQDTASKLVELNQIELLFKLYVEQGLLPKSYLAVIQSALNRIRKNIAVNI